MAKVKFNTLVKDVRNRMGDVVFSKWKETSYVKEYTKQAGPLSEKQAEVRAAFTSTVEIWKKIGGIMHRSWEHLVAKENLTGFNAFIGRNSNLIRSGKPLDLFTRFGETEIEALSFIAQSGTSAGSVVCTFTLPASQAPLNIIFFSQKIENGKGTTQINVHELSASDSSPYTITGLESGADYFIYGVAADAQYASAKSVSASASASVKAGS